MKISDIILDRETDLSQKEKDIVFRDKSVSLSKIMSDIFII